MRIRLAYGKLTPLIHDFKESIYQGQGITFDTLRHLDNIGLISFEPIGGYVRKEFPKITTVFYFDIPIILTFGKDAENDLPLGEVLLSQSGQELASICETQPVEAFLEYIVDRWKQQDIVISQPAE